MKNFFGYIRVSTAKQGEEGVSLQAQRDAISNYAKNHGFTIFKWFEERVTAAKLGRPVFNQMLKDLRAGKALGIIIHKIDRGARNLKDWSNLGELVDRGLEIHTVNETLDLHSRGGRLSADIQAVVAADFIRNLKEETRKGFYGRLKQGLYPLPAPLGYLDKGKAQAKEIDKLKGPLVRKAFEFYGSGRYSLDGLVEELYQLGLRNTNGGKVSRNGLSRILNNPFYIGLIHLCQSGQTFQGIHKPLISKSLFDRAQAVLKGKTNTAVQKNNFVFRKLLSCACCGYHLIGERQKGHIYYRCHTKNCPTTGIREEIVGEEVQKKLATIKFNQVEKDYFQQKIARFKEDLGKEKEAGLKSLDLRLNQLHDRLNRLTDAFLDQVIEISLFEDRKSAILLEVKELEGKRASINTDSGSTPTKLSKFLELAGNALLSYKNGLPEEKRDLVKTLTSNRQVSGKKLDITLLNPFDEVENRCQNTNGDPYRDIPRTLDRLFDVLAKLSLLGELPALGASNELLID